MRQRTLLNHLLAWTLGALALVWASFVVVGFTTGVHEADELTDGHLASVAALEAAMAAGGDGSHASKVDPRDGARPELKNHDYQQSMSVIVWDGSGRVVARTGEAPVPAFDTATGFADRTLGTPPHTWRSFARWDGPDHARKVMALISVDDRDDLAWDIAMQVAGPGLWVMPAIAIALGLAVRRGLQPLHELSRDVLALDAHRGEPLVARQRHEEFKAVVDAINGLVGRQQAALAHERQLASELAHELRTPLASIALHAHSLRGELDAAGREAALQRLERDAVRAGAVVQQVLALARASRTELDEAAAPLDLDALSREVVADYAQRAHASGHELALDSAGAFPLTGHALLLELALRNLLDNACGHTPPGTTVEVQLDAGGRWLQVCDTGPVAVGGRGSAPRDDGFSAGLGLGHRVIEKIAAIHGARFERVPPPAGFCTCFRLQFRTG